MFVLVIRLVGTRPPLRPSRGASCMVPRSSTRAMSPPWRNEIRGRECRETRPLLIVTSDVPAPSTAFLACVC